MKWRLLAVFCGLSLGWGMARSVQDLLPEADPARWKLRASDLPLMQADLTGDLVPDPAALDLQAAASAAPRISPFSKGRVQLRARVPENGQLKIHLGADSLQVGPQQPVMRHGQGHAKATRQQQTQDSGVTLVADRSSRDSVYGVGLSCEPARAPGERFELQLQVGAGQVDVLADGQALTRCQGRWSAGDLVFSSGLLHVQLQELRVESAEGAVFAEDFGGFGRSRLLRLLCGLAGALLFGLAAPRATEAPRGGGIGGALRARLRAPAQPAFALAGLPFLLFPLLVCAGCGPWLQRLRLLEFSDALGPALFAGLPGLAALLGVLAWRAGWGRLAALGLLPPVALAVALGAAGWPHGSWGWILLAALSAWWVLLLRLNSGRSVWIGPLSLLICLLMALQAEAGLRLTVLDELWSQAPELRRTATEFRELLEKPRYRSYPSDGFPVRPPARIPGRGRIVALGGSSTGGAFQMDDIDLFWPKALEERLQGAWQVVNQGVGGWNTLHIRLYLESQIQRLDPDIVVLYAGNNDSSVAPVTMRQAYARYRAVDSRVVALSDFFHRARLYVGLKFAVQAVATPRGAALVPLAHARENTEAIVAAAQAHGARVLLVTEGQNPDPDTLQAYGELQAEVARETGSLYLDGAQALHGRYEPDLFLDDCHLSLLGHRVLAELIEQRLREAGWLE